MAMKGSTVRGTPYHHVGNTAREGMKAGTPKDMEGTSPRGMSSDNRGYQPNPRGGTPYHSDDGNSDEYKRQVAHGTNLESSDHGNQNDPRSNGAGVMLDANGMDRGFSPRPERTMDSPVPGHAPEFDTGFIQEENRKHLGSGNERGNEDLVKGGGVMSRGMKNVSRPGGAETEMESEEE